MDEQHGEGFETGETAEMYLLKWNSHQNHFANKFSELLDEDDISFADVTLACEGHFLQAHRLVLSVCSPFFKNLFKVNCAEKGPATIVLAHIRYTDLENILHFIYRGQVNVKKEDLNNFLETGEQLQIDGLVGQGQNKQSSAIKRRFSEGGQALGKTQSGQQGQSSYMVNRNSSRGSTQTHQTQYKSVTGGNASRMTSSAGSQSNHNNHAENHVKKARISPPISVGSVNKTESVIATTASARRPSTSSSVHQNSSTSSPSHVATGKGEEVDQEVCENNGIKILTVASINSASATTGYDAQGNDVFEILDYEDDDRPDNDMDDSELMNSYGDGGEDGVFYAYLQSPPYGRAHTSQTLSQSSRQTPLVSARYPSIIDGIHFDLISADEKRVAAQCKLCPGEKIIRGSGLTSSNFISHLRAFHKRELEEWREKRKSESKRRLVDQM